MDTDDPDKIALKHAWDWFDLHAAQRMQSFNFFLIATAFLIAAYASLLEKFPLAALILALVGAWVAFWFTRLENRTKQLIKAGEKALKICQANFAKKANLPALEILDAVEEPAKNATSYSIIIGVIEWTIVAVFLLSALYAAYRLSNTSIYL